MAPRSVIAPGDRFGQLTVLRHTGSCDHGRVWELKCDCGNTIECYASLLTRPKKPKRHCGCAPQIGKANRTHGHTLNGPSRTYSSWRAMINRCYTPRSVDFYLYGARGIQVCERWRSSFEAFLADMGERPAGLSIDREDVDGDYSPANCRWATMKAQSRNRRCAARVDFNGASRLLADVADEVGIPRPLLVQRLFSGRSIDEAVAMGLPPKRTRKPMSAETRAKIAAKARERALERPMSPRRRERRPRDQSSDSAESASTPNSRQ